MLGVLPGTGGLTRVVDKRGVRRDLADVFSTRTEGVRGQQAVEWGLVDSVVPRSRFDEHVAERARARAAESGRPSHGPGLRLDPLEWTGDGDAIRYDYLDIGLDREDRAAHLTLRGPSGPSPDTVTPDFWPLALCRQLDHAVSHLRFNEPALGTWVFRSEGDPHHVLAYDDFLSEHDDDWLAREVVLYWKRTLKRLDVSARTLVVLVEAGSCFAGTLAELVLAADRSFMLDQSDARLVLGEANTGWYPMGNGLSRLATRFYWSPDAHADAEAALGKELAAREAEELGLVTFAPDDIDWDDEIRVALEERASFSPDALSGLEANLRFVGPETMETKIFGRLSAWQNWIFQRPNATGPDGALRRYGSGSRSSFDTTRV